MAFPRSKLKTLVSNENTHIAKDGSPFPRWVIQAYPITILIGHGEGQQGTGSDMFIAVQGQRNR